MGREIRRVPPNWEHPKYTQEDAPFSNRIGQYRPLHNYTFEGQASEWLAECLLWSKGEHPDQKEEYVRTKYQFYWQWAGDPPDKNYYRPEWGEGEATWFQVYETVSEGTPVTPPFATKEELVEYLVEHGDSWDEKRGHGGWDRESTVKFVDIGWAPSGIASQGIGFKTVGEKGFYL